MEVQRGVCSMPPWVCNASSSELVMDSMFRKEGSSIRCLQYPRRYHTVPTIHFMRRVFPSFPEFSRCFFRFLTSPCRGISRVSRARLTVLSSVCVLYQVALPSRGRAAGAGAAAAAARAKEAGARSPPDAVEAVVAARHREARERKTKIEEGALDRACASWVFFGVSRGLRMMSLCLSCFFGHL